MTKLKTLKVWRPWERMTSRTVFYHRNYAHRGLHDIENGIPENSMAAFRAAVKGGYGVELDVQLSRDGQVVVFHDDTLKRLCSIKGTVSDYDYSELRKMRILGTQETIPLLSDVLRVLENGAGPLVCELKTGGKNRKLCKKTLAQLRDFKGSFCIESFNPNIVNWFRKNAPDVVRGQLATTTDGYPQIPKILAMLLSRCVFTAINKPHFIAYKNVKRPQSVLEKCKKHKTMIFAWTSKVPGVDQRYNDAVIFEGYRPEPTY